MSEKDTLSFAGWHSAFLAVQADFDINAYLSQTTIRKMYKGFNDYLRNKVFSEFKEGYRETSNKAHPTALTVSDGQPRAEIDSGNVGVLHDAGDTPDR